MKIKAFILCRNFELVKRTVRIEDKDFDFADGTYLIIDDAVKTMDASPPLATLIYQQGDGIPKGTDTSGEFLVWNVWWPPTLRGLLNQRLPSKFPAIFKKLLDPKLVPFYFIAVALLYHFLGGAGAAPVENKIAMAMLSALFGG